MTMAEGDGAGHLFRVGQLTETDWQALAPAAGGVGRFAMDLDRGEAEIDLTFRRLTGLIALPTTFAAADFIAYIHEADRAMVAAAIETARTTGEPYDATYRLIRPTGETIWLRGAGRPIATPDGRNLLIGVATDITEERAAQERAELLAGEMSHRIKNVFTLIQSMFNMAARTADTKEELAEAFTGRLRALVAVNTLTFADPERRVALSDLVDSLLGPLVESGRVRTTLASGFALSGTAAQTVTLAMNELMTNAVKHGALKVPDGHVDLTMSVTDDTFMLRWHEVSPHPVTPPETPGGFGMRVLTGMTKATYDGQPDLDWRPEGLTFTCTWQLEGFGFRAGAGYAAPVAERAVAATIR